MMLSKYLSMFSLVLHEEMDTASEQDLKDCFQKAASFVKTIAGKLDAEILLNLYARYKQV